MKKTLISKDLLVTEWKRMYIDIKYIKQYLRFLKRLHNFKLAQTQILEVQKVNQAYWKFLTLETTKASKFLEYIIIFSESKYLEIEALCLLLTDFNFMLLLYS